MTDQSLTAACFQAPLMAQDLSFAQRSLVDLMHLHQFGRIENMSVRDGQPILDSTVNVVRRQEQLDETQQYRGVRAQNAGPRSVCRIDAC